MQLLAPVSLVSYSAVTMHEQSPKEAHSSDTLLLERVYQSLCTDPDIEGQGNMRHVIEMVLTSVAQRAQELRAMSTEDRRALFEFSDKPQYRLVESILFDHPTFEVFERWLQSQEVIRHKARYTTLYHVVSVRRVSAKIIEKPLKQSVEALKREYKALIDAVYPDVDVVYERSSGPTALRIVSNDVYEKELLLRQAAQTAVKQVLKKPTHVVHHGAQVRYAKFHTRVRDYIDFDYSSLDDTELLAYVSYQGYRLKPNVTYNVSHYVTTPKQLKRVRKSEAMQGLLQRQFERGIQHIDHNLILPTRINYVERDNIAQVLQEFSHLDRYYRHPTRGLVPVGIKLHMPDTPLGAELKKVYRSFPAVYSTPFGTNISRNTVNLPAVPNTEIVSLYDNYFTSRGHESIFANDNISLQVCLPFVASKEHAKILTLALLFGSDNAKVWDHDMFATTHDNQTSRRMLVYGAGIMDENFPFLGMTLDTDEPIVLDALPSDADRRRRTDVLGLKTLRDVEVAQFIGTLLAHIRYNGAYAKLGQNFVQDFENLINHFLEQERDIHTDEDTTGLEQADQVDFVYDDQKHSSDRQVRDDDHNRTMLRLAHVAQDELKLLSIGSDDGRINLVESIQGLIRHYENLLKQLYYSDELAQVRNELGDITTYEQKK